jgi:hypothetical protein
MAKPPPKFLSVSEAMLLLPHRKAKKLEKLVDSIFSANPCHNLDQRLNEIVSCTSSEINTSIKQLIKNLTFNANFILKNPQQNQRLH